MLRQSDGASVARRLREACVHWSDAHCLEKDSLPAGVAGAQIRHEIASAFVAQSLLSAGPFARLARRHARSSGPARCAEQSTRGLWRRDFKRAPRTDRARIVSAFCPHHARFFLESAPNESKFLAL